MTRVLLFKGIAQYDVLRHRTDEVQRAFSVLGRACRVVDIHPDHPAREKEFMEALEVFRPDSVFAFQAWGMGDCLRDGRDVFAAEGIPFYAFMADSPIYHVARLPFRNDPMVVASWPVGSWALHAQSLGVDRNRFLPFGGRQRSTGRVDRVVEILLPGSLTDPAVLRNRWRDRFAPRVAGLIDDTVEAWQKALPQPLHIVFRAVLQAKGIILDGEDLRKLEWVLLPHVDGFLRNYYRLEVVKALRDLPLTIYGNGPWRELVGDGRFNIRNPVSFPLMEEEICRSKVLLNITPSLADGVTERVFCGFFNGAVVAANENRYLDANFGRDNGFLSDSLHNLTELRDKLAFSLTNEAAREEMAERARSVALREHTWEQRVRCVLATLGLESMVSGEGRS